MLIIRRIESLPADMGVLRYAADAEGLHMVATLTDSFHSGANRFERTGEGLWEARVQHDLVGVCGLNIDPFADDAENAGRVRRLYVLPGHGRNGVASTVLDQVERHARGHHDILAVFTTDRRAQALYRSRGYTPVAGVTKRSFQLNLT